MKCSLDISNFLEEISSLCHSVFSLYFFALDTEEGFLLCPILWKSIFKWVYLSFSPLLLASLLYSAICKASSDNHFAFLHFFFLGMVLITVSCVMSWTSVHSSSGTLSELIPWISLNHTKIYRQEVINCCDIPSYFMQKVAFKRFLIHKMYL